MREEWIDAINAGPSAHTADAVVARAVQTFGRGLTFACSFGAEDIVVLDLLLARDPAASVFLLDTGRLHQETYDVIAATRQHYGRVFTTYVPQTAALQALLDADGPNAFYRSVAARKACCHARKVEPLARALAGKAAWLTGLRREQAATRATLPLAEIDAAQGGLVKINPLAHWTTAQVWAYVRERGLPYNALHDRGYPSVGCAPCTRAVAPDEDARAGRWWWEQAGHKECGLHWR